jgi:hypothetical protein
MHNALPETSCSVSQEQRDLFETLLATQVAKLYVQLVELAAVCLGAAMILAIIVVIALRL